MSIWDSKLPESISDVIALLDRRIEVHEAWLASIEAGTADDAVTAGVGTAESHATYADQYRAAQRVLNVARINWELLKTQRPGSREDSVK